MGRHTLLLAATLLAACGHQSVDAPRPAIDLSPVGCGYKWFQSGYSPELAMSCDADRTGLVETETARAVDHAWEIARQRCPSECPPRELQDTTERPPVAPDGVCRGGRVYFTARVFFECRGAAIGARPAL